MQEQNYTDGNSYRYFNFITCNIHIYRRVSQRHTYCHLAVSVSGVRLPLTGDVN